jgi:hypothetical protein
MTITAPAVAQKVTVFSHRAETVHTGKAEVGLGIQPGLFTPFPLTSPHKEFLRYPERRSQNNMSEATFQSGGQRKKGTLVVLVEPGLG